MRDLLTEPSWQDALSSEWDKPYMLDLQQFLEQESGRGVNILPTKENRFKALNLTPIKNIKVVILGQDPYPTAGHAHGLCFSVEQGTNPLPKSLQNIYKELYSDLAIDNSHTGDLSSWAEQGVLLLNAVLSVEEGAANSHKGRGWEKFTDKIISEVNKKCDGVVFVLWGAYAQKKSKIIDKNRHYIINDPHPSPLSAYRGFFGSKPFSRINRYLQDQKREPIDWRIA